MKRLSIVKDLKGYDRYNNQEKGVNEDKVEKIFANDKDRVNYYCHFFVSISKDGKYLYNCCSSEIVIDDKIAIWYESSYNDKDNGKTDYVTS